MPIHLDDKRLVKHLLSGDERAFNRFFEENFSRLYRFAITRTGEDREATRDIVQAALTKGMRNLKSYKGEAALFTWLCVICRNEIVDFHRKNARHDNHQVLIEDHPEIRSIVEMASAPDAASPKDLYQRHEVIRLIQVALDALPPHYGNALEWKYIEGHSVKTIAERLEMTTDAAQSVLARAKRAFRDVYTGLASPLVAEPPLAEGPTE